MSQITKLVSLVNPKAVEDKVIAGFARAGITIDGSAPHDIRIKDRACLLRIAQEGTMGLGESYMDGHWECDALDELFLRLSLVKNERTKSAGRYLMLARSKLENLQSRTKARDVIEQHYDLSNFLYEKMLDPYMQYSCGYWKDATDLATAQQHKLELICRKLELKPGERVLELGGGFGGLARYMAETRGVHVTSYNISDEQMKWARAFNKGLSVDIVRGDWRDAKGTYDKVVSVGLMEHLGRKNHREFMALCHRSLKSEGIFVLHTIGDSIVRPYSDRWILKYIFPGGQLPSTVDITTAADRLFILEDWHNFGPDYDKTLLAWTDQFDAAWPEIQRDAPKSAGMDERFRRMWRYYLLMSAGSFRGRNIQLWQMVFTKGRTGTGWGARPTYT